jgi:zinc protease
MKAPDSMVVSWLSHQGVAQFVGYTIPTWYGKGGWGTSGLWHEGGGTLTLSEAFYLNNQRITLALSETAPELLKESLSNDATKVMTGEGGKMQPPESLIRVGTLVNKLPKEKQKDAMGLIYDRDGVAFYGDPKWEARVDSTTTKARATAAWIEKDGGYDVTITAVKECKGGDALAFMLPHRLLKAEVTTGAETKATVIPDALLIPSPKIEAGKSITLSIRPKK